jgi:hypothetical protein
MAPLCLLAAGLVNQWSLAPLLTIDDRIDSRLVLVGIGALQATGALAAALLWVRRPTLGRGPARAAVALLTLAVLIGVYGSLRATRVIDPDREMRQAWEEVNASEELILSLSPAMERLGRSVMNLEIPDHHSLQLFGSEVRHTRLHVGEPAPSTERFPTMGVSRRAWTSLADTVETPQTDLKLWESLIDSVTFFEHARFAIVRGEFLNAERTAFGTDISFSALARTRAEGWSGVEAALRLTWDRIGDESSDATSWRIREWLTESLELTDSEALLFSETLAQTLAPSVLDAARRSRQEEMLIE